MRGVHNETLNSAKNKAEKIVTRMKKRAREKVESVPCIFVNTLKDILYYWTLNYYKYYCNVNNYIFLLYKLTFLIVNIVGVDILGYSILGS